MLGFRVFFCFGLGRGFLGDDPDPDSSNFLGFVVVVDVSSVRNGSSVLLF